MQISSTSEGKGLAPRKRKMTEEKKEKKRKRYQKKAEARKSIIQNWKIISRSIDGLKIALKREGE